MNAQKIVFLSGPISDKPDTYQADFANAAEAVASVGYIPLNPATLPFGLSERSYMRITLAMMDAADLVLQLPGWINSEGAMAEATVADKTGIPRMQYTDFLAENDLDFTVPKPEPEAAPPKKRLSRTERLFGSKDTWGKDGAATQESPEPPASFERKSVKGFSILECEDCHNIKVTCIRYPITEHTCRNCGHVTKLDFDAMLPAFFRCKCGQEYKYRTNATAASIPVNCLKCGSTVRLELNQRGTAYITTGIGVAGARM